MGEKDLVVGVDVNIGRRLRGLKLAVGLLEKTGKWLVGLAIVVVVWFTWPVVGEEIKYSLGQTWAGKTAVKMSNTRVELVREIGLGEEPKEERGWIAPDENYSVYIPRILAKSRVIPNVDPGDREEYMWALKRGVAEAAGLSHPGEPGTTYLFAHSVGSRSDFARYNAIFYLLHRMEEGDGIEIVYKGGLYKYVVEKKEILEAADLKYLQNTKGGEKLVLQTCYPPGTSWKRLVLTARRVMVY